MPIVDPRVINKYLDFDFDNHTWMKDLDEAEVQEIIDELRPIFDPPFKMDKHQKVCFLLCLAYLEFYLHLEMGTGKTLIMFAVFWYLMKIGKVKRGLVVVPTDENVEGWREEIEEWCPELPFTLLKGSGEAKWEGLEALTEGLGIMSYPGLVRLCCEKQKVKKFGAKKAKIQFVPVKQSVDWIAEHFDVLIMDEITKAGNSQSLTFDILNRISRRVCARYGLAGKMFGRDPMLVWAQFFLIDRGTTFGKSIGFFRSVFFTEKDSYFGGPWTKDYKFKKEMQETFARIQNHRSITYTTEEAGISLPPVTPRKAYVDLPRSSQEYYERTLRELKAGRGNLRETQNNFMRLRQISSGFVGFFDDDEGEKATLEFPENPKLDRLMDLIEQMNEDRKFVISVDFTWSGARIMQELAKAKIRVGWLYGKTKDWPSMKRALDHEKTFRGIVVQNKKAAYGLNLQSANYLFIYESPVSVLERDQLVKRLPRRGQKLPVFQWDLLMRNTADESILVFHREGRSLFKALVRDPEKVLRMR